MADGLDAVPDYAIELFGQEEIDLSRYEKRN